MNAEHTRQLLIEFPDLFAHGEELGAMHPAVGGFGCADGWFMLLHRLCRRLAELDREQPAGQALLRARQVKQKFGTLRFYLDGGDAAVGLAVNAAEEESARTCERCGGPGELRERRGWFATLCTHDAPAAGGWRLAEETHAPAERYGGPGFQIRVSPRPLEAPIAPPPPLDIVTHGDAARWRTLWARTRAEPDLARALGDLLCSGRLRDPAHRSLGLPPGRRRGSRHARGLPRAGPGHVAGRPAAPASSALVA